MQQISAEDMMKRNIQVKSGFDALPEKKSEGAHIAELEAKIRELENEKAVLEAGNQKLKNENEIIKKEIEELKKYIRDNPPKDGHK